MNSATQVLFKTFLFLSLTFSVTPSYGQEITTYYLIRHAEKNLSDKNNFNPYLTKIGKERAQAWKEIFKEVAFDQIYSTPYHRTQETARPTAEEHQLVVKQYDPKNLYSSDFRKATYGKTVLVVGHSNTTPELANKILNKKKYDNIDERIHGNLYIIQCLGDKVNAQLLTLE